MKLYTALSLLGFAAGALVLSTAACGSDDGGSSTPTSSGRTPPAVPDAPVSNTPARTFAVNQLFLGETDRGGASNREAWRDYGFDLDGLTTTKTSTNVCSRVGGADSSKQEDGAEGIDNAFGRTILGFLTGLVASPSRTVNDGIANGEFTVLLSVSGLDDTPNQTATGLSGEILIGGTFPEGTRPNFSDPTLDWPYRADPRVPVTGAYINNGTFVNGTGGARVRLSLFIQGVSLSLNINKAFITFQHQPPNDLTNGTIAGVIATEELVTGIEAVAGRISPDFCGGATLEQVKNTIRQASDILIDGSNREGVACDGISVGLGFTAKRVGDPKTVAAEEPPPVDPCTNPDGGT